MSGVRGLRAFQPLVNQIAAYHVDISSPPSGFIVVSDTQAYKQFGNALVPKAIGREIPSAVNGARA